MRTLADHLPPERSGHPPSPQLAAMYEGTASAIAAGTWRTDPPPVEKSIGGVRVLCFAPPGQPRARVLHFHGGGFRMGCPESIGPYASRLAQRCGVEVLCPAYRLAPVHPFPAGLTDAARLADVVRQAEDHLPVVLSGDSAGGGLAASLAALCTTAGVGFNGLVLHSPWLDLTLTSPSYDENAGSDPLFSLASASEASRLYLQGHDPHDPLVSPLFAEVSGFPATLVTVGTGEVLLEDSRRFHARLEENGVSSRLVEIDGMDHVAVTRDFSLPGSEEAFQATVTFMAGI